MTCPNDTNDKSEPSLRLILPGVLTPSLNVTHRLHWATRAKLRKAWSILIARCLYGLLASDAKGSLTRTISLAAVRNCAMRSLTRSVERVILPKRGSLGNTSKRIMIEVWEL